MTNLKEQIAKLNVGEPVIIIFDNDYSTIGFFIGTTNSIIGNKEPLLCIVKEGFIKDLKVPFSSVDDIDKFTSVYKISFVGIKEIKSLKEV